MKLLRYLRTYRKEAILAPLFKMLEATFELFVPLVVARMIDVGIAQSDRGVLYRSVLILILLCGVGFAASVTAQYFSAKAAAGFAKRVRHDLFENIQALSVGQIDRLGTSSLITRMTSDMNQVQQGVNLTLRLLLRSPFVVLGAMVMAFTIDVREAMIFAVAIPILSLVVYSIMRWCIPRYRSVQNELDGVTTLVRENLSGVRVIRAFRREEAETAHFHQENTALTALQEHVGRVSALMNPLTQLLLNLAVAVLIYTGAVRVQAGALSQGEVVALYNYMSQILIELVKFANLILTITRAVACANRIQAILEETPDMADGTKMSWAHGERDTPLVSFEHVYMRYPGAAEDALEDIDFKADRGMRIGVIGGTGSGKSTLVHLIPRFYDGSAGTVRVDGQDVREMSLSCLRDRIGIVPQRAVLFAGTIRDNLRWGEETATDEEMWDALEAAQAAEFVREKQGGLDYRIAQGGKNLSGGQRQRLTIARALVRKPDILILDDASSALDYATDLKLRRALQTIQPQTVTFLVSQRTSSLRGCDLILVLDDGRLVGKGRHEELLETCPVYREIHESQSGTAEEVRNDRK